MSSLISGLITGMVFGFLLQRARVIRYDRQIGALRLQDMTIVKFMFSGILVALVGIYVLHDIHLVALRVLPATIGANIIGGIIFGLGWGLLGYCPGTSAGALGEGRWDSVWGIVGMTVGAGLYAESFPFLSKKVLALGALSSRTIPEALGVSHWLIIPVFIAIGIGLFVFFEKKGL